MPTVYISDYGLLTYKEDICIPHLHLTSATKDAVMLWKRGWESRKGSRKRGWLFQNCPWDMTAICIHELAITVVGYTRPLKTQSTQSFQGGWTEGSQGPHPDKKRWVAF